MCPQSAGAQRCASRPPRSRCRTACPEPAAACERAAATCSGQHVSFVSAAVQNAPVSRLREGRPLFRLHLRAGAKVTVFIEKRPFWRGAARQVKEPPTAIGKCPETQAKTQFRSWSPESAHLVVFSIFKRRNHGARIAICVSPARRCDFRRRDPADNPGDEFFFVFCENQRAGPASGLLPAPEPSARPH